MAELVLAGGQIAQIDNDDVAKTKHYRWCVANTGRKTGKPKRYVVGFIPGTGRPAVYLHRFVMDAPKGNMIDHVNGDTLDCRKSNLRFVNSNQNAHNRQPNDTYKGQLCSSKFKGVSREFNKWRTQIGYLRVIYRIGAFENEIQAAEAYDDFSHWLHGVFGSRNFPDRQTREIGCTFDQRAPGASIKAAVQSYKNSRLQGKLEGK